MKLKELSLVLLRVLALYGIMEGLREVSTVLVELVAPNQNSTWYLDNGVLGAVGCIWIVIGIILWIMSGRLSGYLVSGTREEEESPNYEAGELYILGMTLTGVVLVALNLPNLIGQILTLCQYALSGHADAYAHNRAEEWIAAAVSLFKIFIGLILMLGASGIVRWIREAGMDNGSNHKG